MTARPADPSSHGPDGLWDRFGRHVTYVRLSVTDRCDLRCVYCMAEDMRFTPRSQLLTLEEIARLGRLFGELGVVKLRITGGEPLVRRNVLWLFQRLGELSGIRDLTLTTNGTQLAHMAGDLVAAGVTRVNISLDTLDAGRFPGHHPPGRHRQDPGRDRGRPPRGVPPGQAEQRGAQEP